MSKIESGSAAPTSSASETDWRIVLLGVLIVSGVYVFSNLARGWFPFDDGMLAQSAERVIQGQLPHRDFDEVYTGGLSMLNAVAFRMLGTTLWTLRVVLFAVFLAWIPVVFYIASRFAKPVAAGAVTLVAVVWSLPNYNAAMPSWYNLFFATFGTAALFRYLEVERPHWLFLAGVAGGLSFLVKVVGLYYIAAVLLFLVFHASNRARATPATGTERGRWYAIFVSASLALFVGALFALIRHQFLPAEFVQFVLPGALISLLLVHNEWTSSAASSRVRFESLARLLVPFLAGVVLPIALFLVPFVRSGSVGILLNGLFVLPAKRFQFAISLSPSLRTMRAMLPFALLLFIAQRIGPRGRRILAIVAGIVLLYVIRLSGRNAVTYVGVWSAVRNLAPVLTLIGVAVLCRERDADARDPMLRARTLLMISVAALCSVIRFPFDAANYFCYIAPLVALAALALNSYLRPTGNAVKGVLVTFLILFAVFRSNGKPLQSMGFFYLPAFEMKPLTFERGGVTVPTMNADVYHEVIPLLKAHARGGYTWASPDAPEIYFLANLRNPTRSLYEFLEDSAGYEQRTLALLDAHAVTAVVLNRMPFVSPHISEGMNRELQSRFPESREIGPFVVRWRN